MLFKLVLLKIQLQNLQDSQNNNHCEYGMVLFENLSSGDPSDKVKS